MKNVIMVNSQREIDENNQAKMRFYSISLVLLDRIMGLLVRFHWVIENSLHWVGTFSSTMTSAVSGPIMPPANLATIKHVALDLTRPAPGKDFLRVGRKIAAWDDDFRADLIQA